MEPLDLTDLADRAGVSIRTVRYYIQQGLLSGPEARGPGAHYSDEHLDRILLIKRLQKEHLPLAEIRRVIDSSAAEVQAPASARDYIASVLGKPPAYVGEPVMSSPPPERYSTAPARSQWERVALTRDVELHIRRPLSRAANRAVDQVIEYARTILEEDS